MKIMVISLGGSLIVPEKIDYKFLEDFKHTLRKHYGNWKFVVVCGGGTVARKYISILRADKQPEKQLSLAGIMATRTNARVMMQFFGKEANDALPGDMKDVKNELKKNNVVICGALRYTPHSTSDGTAARLANFLGGEFINVTNVKGLFTANPYTHKDARFIAHESWKQFEKRATARTYHSGQHFVLDQEAAVLIRKHKIKTYIVGDNPKNIDKILGGKKFIGTSIFG
ncbi:MAG: hypothetical protein MUF61_02765 [archaeon]|jgi:uridylate kinase|nr:hypothetical protein [archaeon]